MAQPILRQLDEETAIARGGQLCELAAHVHSALAELALLAAAFDADTGWGGAGIRSCAHWLAIQAGLDLSTSADLLRVVEQVPEQRGVSVQGPEIAIR